MSKLDMNRLERSSLFPVDLGALPAGFCASRRDFLDLCFPFCWQWAGNRVRNRPAMCCRWADDDATDAGTGCGQGPDFSDN